MYKIIHSVLSINKRELTNKSRRTFCSQNAGNKGRTKLSSVKTVYMYENIHLVVHDKQKIG